MSQALSTAPGPEEIFLAGGRESGKDSARGTLWPGLPWQGHNSCGIKMDFWGMGRGTEKVGEMPEMEAQCPRQGSWMQTTSSQFMLQRNLQDGITVFFFSRLMEDWRKRVGPWQARPNYAGNSEGAPGSAEKSLSTHHCCCPKPRVDSEPLDKHLSGRRLQATPVGECDSEMEWVSRSRATNLAWMHELYGGRRNSVVRGPERRERVDMDEHLGPVKPWPDL